MVSGLGLLDMVVTASACFQEKQHHRGCGREHDQLGPVTDLWGTGKPVPVARGGTQSVLLKLIPKNT